MALAIKRKRSSGIIAFFDFLLGLGIAFCFIMSRYLANGGSGFDYNAIIQTASQFWLTRDWKQASIWAEVLAFGAPAVFSLLSLFLSKVARWSNVLTIVGFSFSILYSLAICAYGVQLFNFSSGPATYLSICLILALVGFLFSFINLEKSK